MRNPDHSACNERLGSTWEMQSIVSQGPAIPASCMIETVMIFEIKPTGAAMSDDCARARRGQFPDARLSCEIFFPGITPASERFTDCGLALSGASPAVWLGVSTRMSRS
jgi:hypothetical protein